MIAIKLIKIVLFLSVIPAVILTAEKTSFCISEGRFFSEKDYKLQAIMMADRFSQTVGGLKTKHDAELYLDAHPDCCEIIPTTIPSFETPTLDWIVGSPHHRWFYIIMPISGNADKLYGTYVALDRCSKKKRLFGMEI